LRRYAVALCLTFVASGLIAIIRSRADVANVSMLYLLAVLATAVLYGTWPAVVASVAALLSYDFFFVRPQHTFNVANEEEWLDLVLLLIAGIVTGQLATALRGRARDAEQREREAVVLYDVVRLMAQPEFEQALRSVAERLRSEIDVSAVTITLATDRAVEARAESGDSDSVALAREALRLPDMLLPGGNASLGTKLTSVGRWVRIVPPTAARRHSERVHSVPISLRGGRVGALVLVARGGAPPFGREVDRLLSIVANQLGLALERLRLQREANESEALRRTDELRTALMNAVSHDLRTPLSSIIASAGSLLQDDVSWNDEERRRFLTTIESDAERLNRLVGNLLDLSRIQGGSLRPEKGWYELGSLIREVAGRLAFMASQHSLVLDVPDELPPMLFDYVELDQVVTNLIENAIKHTPPGTRITLSARVLGDQVRVEITDNGPGIPDEALPRLFEAFYRGGNNAVRPRGSGLGLTVSRGLIEAHGGRLWVENVGGGGARFAFEFPVGPAGAHMPAERPA